MNKPATTSALWQWSELCAACNLDPVTGPDIFGISIDSRTLSAGDLFIALSGDPGPKFHSSGSSGLDGHNFIEAALAAGAAGVMVSRDADYPCATLQVADTLEGLWQLGRAGRGRMSGKVVAVTGSAGKTTFRQWMDMLLSVYGLTHASVGSLNNHWGVPLSLARMPAASQFGVFEVGTNNPGEISPLSKLVSPHISVLLNVLPAHLGRFPSMAALQQEKLSIADGLDDAGILVCHESMAGRSNAPREVVFGLGDDADVRGSATYASTWSDVTLSIGQRQWQYRLGTTGEHRVLTSLAVCATLHALGLDPGPALPAFESLTVPAGRGDTVTEQGVTIVDDSYNANPVSMRYALEALARTSGQRVAILGEMLELGASAPAMHGEIAQYCDDLDGVITVGEGFANWPGPASSADWGHYDTAAEIDLDALAVRLSPEATILVKGSNKVFWTTGFVARLREAIRRR